MQLRRMTSGSIAPTAALVADAIARIEERRVALDLLADQGMAMVERLVAGETVEIAGRKPFESTARAFAVISRAVRLCLALASRLDEELIALLRGGPIPDLAILAPENSGPKASTAEQEARPPLPAPASASPARWTPSSRPRRRARDRRADARLCRGTPDRGRGLRRLPPPALAGRRPGDLRRPRPPSRLEHVGQGRTDFPPPPRGPRPPGPFAPTASHRPPPESAAGDKGYRALASD